MGAGCPAGDTQGFKCADGSAERCARIGDAAVALGPVTIGGAVAYALSGFLKSLLFGVRPFDLITYAAVLALLLAMAALASWAPARRAARTDPAIALRLE